MAHDVTLQTNQGTENQRWKFESSNGYYIIVNKATGEVLDLAGSSNSRRYKDWNIYSKWF
ncbi:MAG: RICIN domain-containing protein [Muricomes sp.]